VQQEAAMAEQAGLWICRGLLQSFPWTLSYIARYRLNCLSRRRSQSCRTGVSTLLVISCIIAGLEDEESDGHHWQPTPACRCTIRHGRENLSLFISGLIFYTTATAMASMIRFLLSAACPHLTINPHDHACVVMCDVRW
jgi:hypothetical protein